jgi:exosortase
VIKAARWYWALIIGLTLVVFLPVLVEMVRYWTDNPDYSHCFAVPFLAGFLVYKKRFELVQQPSVSSTAGGVALALALMLYGVSFIGGIVFAQRLALVFSLHAVVWFNEGWARYRKIAVPMFFLFLMVPVPVTLHNMVAFPMQLFATNMAENLLKWAHVPVLQRGNILHFPNGALEVVEACSGIRSLLAFFTLGSFVAYWNRDRLWKASLLILSTVPIALAANILRIAVSGWMGFVYGMDVAYGFMHDVSGIALFMFGFGAFLFESHTLDNLTYRRVALKVS